jgi:hypothetical protein
MYCKVRLFNFCGSQNNGVTLIGSQPEGLGNLSNRLCEETISLCWRENNIVTYFLTNQSIAPGVLA